MVQCKEWFRPASSGEGQIFSRLWVGDEPPRAVLQIAHGMAEHGGRYDAFATFLAQRGFAVCMNDHAGHGKSAQVKGYFAQRDGWTCLQADMKALMDEVSGQYPGLPIFLLGHSMGSFLTRCYITRYGGDLAGCILSGTMGANPALGLARALAKLQIKVKGPASPGVLLDRLGSGGYCKRISNPVNGFAWLSRDEGVCAAYAADPLCGFPFTASGYYDMYGGIGEISSPAWAARVPKNLPLYLFAGDGDPVGAYGAGPSQVCGWLTAGREDVTLKLYPGGRHEMLNETNRQEVYGDVLAWLEGHLSRPL